MKRLIAAGIILALVLTLSLSGIYSVRGHSKEIRGRIEEIRTDAISEQETYGKAKAFVSYWEEVRDPLSVFVNHGDLNEIGRAAAQMAAAEQSKSVADLLEAADEILFILDGIEADERFTLFSFI